MANLHVALRFQAQVGILTEETTPEENSDAPRRSRFYRREDLNAVP